MEWVWELGLVLGVLLGGCGSWGCGIDVKVVKVGAVLGMAWMEFRGWFRVLS